MDPRVRIAVIGAGLIGHRHIKYIQDDPRCRLTGVVDPYPQAQSLAQAAKTAYYPDIDSFLKRTDAEAVIIATPNDTHTPIGIRCAQAGLHLLVEKPIDADPANAEKLIDAANQAGVGMLVGHHRRFNPYIEAAKTILDEARLGSICAVNALWTTFKPDDYFNVSWRRQPGGGPVLINLIHDVDNLRYLFGDVTRVYAEMNSHIRRFPVEDTAAIVMRFNSGVLATIITSDTVASPYNFESATGENPLLHAAHQDCYRIFGTKATLSLPDMTLWQYTDKEKQGWAFPISSERIDVAFDEPIKKQLRHFCDIARQGAVPRCSGADALKTLKSTLAVARAVKGAEPVEMMAEN